MSLAAAFAMVRVSVLLRETFLSAARSLSAICSLLPERSIPPKSMLLTASGSSHRYLYVPAVFTLTLNVALSPSLTVTSLGPVTSSSLPMRPAMNLRKV